MKWRKAWRTLIVLALMMTACTTANTIPPTPTIDPATPAAATDESATQSAISTQLIAEARTTARAYATAEAKSKENVHATATQGASLTEAAQTAEAYLTETAASKQTSTAQAYVQATEQAAPALGIINILLSDGSISTNKGTYHQLGDFDQSWAQMNWYRWWYIDYEPDNFVLHTRWTWTTASMTAEWWSSGCGFVYHVSDVDNHYLMSQFLDGNLLIYRVKDGRGYNVKSAYYGRPDLPTGSADVVLAVEDSKMSVYLNGKKYISVTDDSLLHGKIGLTLNSGTNKDFGTRCEMKDLWLWEINK